MTTWAIGDIQGCYEPLRCLLKQIKFKPDRDSLWLAGDLINRGPESLEVLRYVKSLGDSVRVVLGNHDLHFLAVALGGLEPRSKDTFDDVLDAPDCDELADWLRQQPLLYHDKALGYAMVHAGIPPIWSLKKARNLAHEVELVLQSKKAPRFLKAMYGDEPACWSDELSGMTRLRVITNYLTRMRFCSSDGTLDLADKTHTRSARSGFLPWFEHELKGLGEQEILFGHWAALEGHADHPQVHALDTGCIWGGSLTAMSLEDRVMYQCQCIVS